MRAGTICTDSIVPHNCRAGPPRLLDSTSSFVRTSPVYGTGHRVGEVVAVRCRWPPRNKLTGPNHAAMPPFPAQPTPPNPTHPHRTPTDFLRARRLLIGGQQYTTTSPRPQPYYYRAEHQPGTARGREGRERPAVSSIESERASGTHFETDWSS